MNTMTLKPEEMLDRICGFVRYTCEKKPRVIAMNETMRGILRITGPESEQDLCGDGVLMMIPVEERRRFVHYLNRVYSGGMPISGEISLIRADGRRIYVLGWVSKYVGSSGEEEFQSVCMDVTEQHREKVREEAKHYLEAIRCVYDKIFEFDFSVDTVRCLHCEDHSTFKSFENIAVQFGDALEDWIVKLAHPDDRASVLAFFENALDRAPKNVDAASPQVNYRARSYSGEYRKYSGVFIRISETISYYCCRCMVDTADETESLRKENTELRKLIRRMTDGIAAFRISADGCVKPLYASENVCEFFGFSENEWETIMENPVPLEEFVANSEARYEDFEALLRNGEAEFTYFDYTTEKTRRVRAVCSRREHGSGSNYIMLYFADGEKDEEGVKPAAGNRVAIRTFGYFDVFVNGKPIAFRNRKSKELLALLVDRKGGFVSAEEVIGFLWDDDPVNPLTLSRYRKVALRLKNLLEEYGVPEIVETVDGKRRIVPEAIRCDLYDYLSGREEYAQLFKGSYLTNYSWGETTLGELAGDLY